MGLGEIAGVQFVAAFRYEYVDQRLFLNFGNSILWSLIADCLNKAFKGIPIPRVYSKHIIPIPFQHHLSWFTNPIKGRKYLSFYLWRKLIDMGGYFLDLLSLERVETARHSAMCYQ